MYGTVFHMKIKKGKETQLFKMFQDWDKNRRPKVKGSLGGFMLMPDNKADEVIGIAIFKDKKTYFANANDPAQDKWYKSMRTLLKEDPQWEDGEYVWGEYTGPKSYELPLH